MFSESPSMLSPTRCGSATLVLPHRALAITTILLSSLTAIVTSYKLPTAIVAVAPIVLSGL